MEKELSNEDYFSENYGEDVFNKVESLYENGIWKTKQGEYKKSMDNLFKTIDELKQIPSERQGLDIAKCWNKIGDNYLKMKEYDKAFEYLNKSLNIKKKQSDALELAEVYQSLANYYDSIDDVQQSVDFKELIYKIRLEQLGENSSLTADSINNLAISLMKLSDSKKAEEYFLKSCAIRQNLSENKPSKELADSFYNLGMIYEKINDFKKSLENFSKAYEIRKSIFVDDVSHQDLIESLSSMYIVYKRLGNEQEANKFGEMALERKQKMEREKFLLEADLFYTLGYTYKIYDNETKALELFSKSYMMRKKIFTKKHTLIENIVNSMNRADNLSETNYADWNYIQLFKWIQINGINPKIIEIYFRSRFDGLYLKELISMVNKNKDMITSEIKDHSDEISQHDIEHFFKCLQSLSKNKKN